MSKPRKMLNTAKLYKSHLYGKRMADSSPKKSRETKTMFFWRGKRILIEPYADKSPKGTPFFYWNGKKIGCNTRRMRSEIESEIKRSGSFVDKPPKEIFSSGEKSQRGIIEKVSQRTTKAVITKILLRRNTREQVNSINFIIHSLRINKDPKIREQLVEILERKGKELAMPKELLEKLKSIGQE
ncbi:hypothetical protein KKG83_01540 [Candidatus Micrarchaeota archaeon]|nr:hypothetical protein [Candidatus Micrarchaeota archaeon]MBU2476132.1 hypothetical protein [Candidatus Micrarchaeota archaeon]